ncbi:MAG TPA: S-methyl-5-thioribose-1-phosphate isomerase [Thermoproteota archaeon]|nr:S-methyl-5-thioribose-1-phosphate isomerase [Thermoproteota archaeon]
MGRTIRWERGTVVTIDQTLLPHHFKIIRLRTLPQVLEAIREMKIRGAPIIGVAAAYALALEAYRDRHVPRQQLVRQLRKAGDLLRSTRPTGRDMHRAVERVLSRVMTASGDVSRITLLEAQSIANEYERAERQLVKNGQSLIEDGDVILTHCNSGPLATVAWGTGLGILLRAWKSGKRISVIATETRPMLQGARLTAWELKHNGVPFKLITDSMVGYVLARGLADKVLVGADRIWKDGSVANKIGTLTIATLAKEYRVPFYVAAPMSTFDPESSPNYSIIETRDPREILEIGGERIAPPGTKCLNPAFDITPAEHISAIVTERGVLRPPFRRSINRALSRRGRTTHTLE